MRFKLIILYLMFSLTFSVCAVRIFKLPEKELLNYRFTQRGLNYFDEKTDIAAKLGNKELSPADVIRIIDEALCDYEAAMKSTGISIQRLQVTLDLMYNQRQSLLEEIFKDEIGALLELQELGIYN